ncbi:MlaD family protein [Halarcobacter sp.]|uniref:MlaD family protein n=1 Tax=Halarcobacter sp. TaxID=2321133 RepID=UPI0029F4F8DD|nr:MlaD family protein [Halarcobacter sp.]
MENKAKYTTVGLFVLIFTIGMVAFILWLARYNVDDITAREYRVYSTNSVAGLNKNSIVQYKGLNIGTVKDIRVNPKNLEEIEIILKVTQPQLIKTDSFAIIESQGVTGNKLVEISGGSQDAKILEQNKDATYTKIPLKKSFIDKITSSAGNITTNIETLLKRIELLLNDKNIKNIENILSNSSDSTKNLNILLKKANTLVETSLPNTLNNIDKMTNSIDEVVRDDISNVAKEVNTLAKNFNSVSSDIKIIINEDVKHLLEDLRKTAKSSQNIDGVLDKLENTIEKIDSTIEDFNENGGNMIFNTREIPYGPGEKND